MDTIRRLLVAAACAAVATTGAGAGAAARAQEPVSALRPGDRVRLDAPALHLSRAAGRVVAGGEDSVTVRVNGLRWPVAVPYERIGSLEVWRRSGSAAGKGAVIGGLVGAGFMAVTDTYVSYCGDGFLCGPISAGSIVASLAVGTAVGAGLGALVGATKRGGWRSVALPSPADAGGLTLGPAPGGVRIGWSLRF